MKQIAQNYKTGELLLLDVPVPATRRGGVVVRTEYSLISSGTEKMKVAESKMSLAAKARARPDQVRKVIETVGQQGLGATYRKVMNRLDAYTPLGYSLVGIVEDVGEGVDEFAVGQRVACAGNAYALHAEWNWVPKNLCVPVPDGVEVSHAAFTTVGAIAMQGYRQAAPQLGEVAVVIGLGLVGQLLLQILAGAGLHTLGLDVSAERCQLAEQLGATAAGVPGTESYDRVVKQLAALSGGHGADCVFLAAGTDSRDPVFTAAELARDRARVVDIGKTNLDLPWNEYYEKELEVLFSRSYGPGRYDPTYEEAGVDYPIGYVRWTERRNMSAFLGLMAAGKLDLGPLVSEVVPFEQAVGAYERLHAGELGGIGVLFEYGPTEPARTTLGATHRSSAPPRVPPQGALTLASIGAGNYATSMLLPHLAGRADVTLDTVVTSTSLSAATAQRRFGFTRTATDYREVLADESINAVLVATRHDTHAEITAAALAAGKAVFVEKPLALDEAELEMVLAAAAGAGNDRLMVGYNRRFAPLLRALREAWGPAGPAIVDYTVNAGALATDSWYRDAHRHGSRFVGEGGHFVDTVSWWIGADPASAFAAATPSDADNLVCQLEYPDGSIATIKYLTDGDRRFPKEHLSAFGDGKVAVMRNFGRVDLWSGGKRRFRRSLKGVDKGQRDQLDAFVSAITTGSPMPISLESLRATSAATFAVARSAATGEPASVAARGTSPGGIAS